MKSKFTSVDASTTVPVPAYPVIIATIIKVCNRIKSLKIYCDVIVMIIKNPNVISFIISSLGHVTGNGLMLGVRFQTNIL